jgi:predicted unusual protein kinase regulating ubiquinone biosynthesis (AarF/ABC1/UbiB family)
LDQIHSKFGEKFGKEWSSTQDNNSLNILAATSCGGEVEDHLIVGANNHVLVEILSQQTQRKSVGEEEEEEEENGEKNEGKSSNNENGFEMPADTFSAFKHAITKWSKILLLRPSLMLSHAIRLCELLFLFGPPVLSGIMLVTIDYCSYLIQSKLSLNTIEPSSGPLSFDHLAPLSKQSSLIINDNHPNPLVNSPSDPHSIGDNIDEFTYKRPELITHCYTLWWKWFRTVLKFSGSTFVKLGQYLSCRPDILSPDICHLLSQLQSNNTTHSYQDTTLILNKELPFWEEYLYITPEDREAPIGSGSIAQVYRALLDVDKYKTVFEREFSYNKNHHNNEQNDDKDGKSDSNKQNPRGNPNYSELPSQIATLVHTVHAYLPNLDQNENNPEYSSNIIPVAIKITHPTASPSITRDLQLLFFIMEMVEVIPSATIQCASPTTLVTEFARMMLSQLDLRQEGRNLVRFQHNFQSVDFDLLTPVFPTPILSRKDVLIESFHTGLGGYDLIEQYQQDETRYGPVIEMNKKEEKIKVNNGQHGVQNGDKNHKITHQIGFSPMAVQLDDNNEELTQRVTKKDKVDALYDILSQYHAEQSLYYQELEQYENQIELNQHGPESHHSNLPKPTPKINPSHIMHLAELRHYQQEEIVAAMSPEQFAFITSSVASAGLETFLLMLFSTGFFHADLHAGNIMLDLGFKVMDRETLDGVIRKMKEKQDSLRMEKSRSLLLINNFDITNRSIKDIITSDYEELFHFFTSNISNFFKTVTASKCLQHTLIEMVKIITPSSLPSLLPPSLSQPLELNRERIGDRDTTDEDLQTVLETTITEKFFNKTAYNPSKIMPSPIFNILNSSDTRLHSAYDTQPGFHYKSLFYEHGIPQPESKPSIVLLDCGLATGLSFRDRTNFNDLFYAIAVGRGYEAAAMMVERAPNIFTSTQAQYNHFYQTIEQEQHQHLAEQRINLEQEEVIKRRIYQKASFLGKLGLLSEDFYQVQKSKLTHHLESSIESLLGSKLSTPASEDSKKLLTPGSLLGIPGEKRPVLESFDFGPNRHVVLKSIPYNPLQTRQNRLNYITNIGDLITKARSHGFSLSSTQAVEILLTLVSSAQANSISLDTSFVGVIVATLCIEGVGRSLNATIDVIGPGVSIIGATTLHDAERQVQKLGKKGLELTENKIDEILGEMGETEEKIRLKIHKTETKINQILEKTEQSIQRNVQKSHYLSSLTGYVEDKLSFPSSYDPRDVSSNV